MEKMLRSPTLGEFIERHNDNFKAFAIAACDEPEPRKAHELKRAASKAMKQSKAVQAALSGLEKQWEGDSFEHLW